MAEAAEVAEALDALDALGGEADEGGGVAAGSGDEGGPLLPIEVLQSSALGPSEREDAQGFSAAEPPPSDMWACNYICCKKSTFPISVPISFPISIAISVSITISIPRVIYVASATDALSLRASNSARRVGCIRGPACRQHSFFGVDPRRTLDGTKQIMVGAALELAASTRAAPRPRSLCAAAADASARPSCPSPAHLTRVHLVPASFAGAARLGGDRCKRRTLDVKVRVPPSRLRLLQRAPSALSNPRTRPRHPLTPRVSLLRDRRRKRSCGSSDRSAAQDHPPREEGGGGARTR